jgi:predicted lipid carrier protein YhbT
VADKLIKREFNNTSQATINQYGNYPVVGLKLMRTPIMKVLNVVLNAISLGKWSELKKKYNFDDMYHLALVATVQIGSGQKDVVMEKNAQINVSTSFGVNSKTEQLDIPLNGKKLTVNGILNNGISKVGKEKFFLYDPLTNNCQYYCSYLLQGVGLYNFNTRNFLYQNVEGIRNELSEGTKQTMLAATNLGALVGQITGAGLTVHAVKIHKRIPMEEQLKYVEFLAKSWKEVHVKELNNSFKFELKPRKKIKKGTLKTVKIDGNVTLLVGELNE